MHRLQRILQEMEGHQEAGNRRKSGTIPSRKATVQRRSRDGSDGTRATAQGPEGTSG